MEYKMEGGLDEIKRREINVVFVKYISIFPTIEQLIKCKDRLRLTCESNNEEELRHIISEQLIPLKIAEGVMDIFCEDRSSKIMTLTFCVGSVDGCDEKILRHCSKYIDTALAGDETTNNIYISVEQGTAETFTQVYQLMTLLYKHPDFYEKVDRLKYPDITLSSVFEAFVHYATNDPHGMDYKRKELGNPKDVAELFADSMDRFVRNKDDETTRGERSRTTRVPTFKCVDYDKKDYTPINMTEEDIKEAYDEMERFNALSNLLLYLDTPTLSYLVADYLIVIHHYENCVKYHKICIDYFDTNLEIVKEIIEKEERERKDKEEKRLLGLE